MVYYTLRGRFTLYINPNNGLCTPLFSTNVFNIKMAAWFVSDNILYGISNNPLPQSLIEIDHFHLTSTNLGPVNFLGRK